MSAMTLKIGQTTIRVEVEGCTRCGGKWSHAWIPVRHVPLSFDGREPKSLTVHMCGTCAGLPVPPCRYTRKPYAVEPIAAPADAGVP